MWCDSERVDTLVKIHRLAFYHCQPGFWVSDGVSGGSGGGKQCIKIKDNFSEYPNITNSPSPLLHHNEHTIIRLCQFLKDACSNFEIDHCMVW